MLITDVYDIKIKYADNYRLIIYLYINQCINIIYI